MNAGEEYLSLFVSKCRCFFSFQFPSKGFYQTVKCQSFLPLSGPIVQRAAVQTADTASYSELYRVERSGPSCAFSRQGSCEQLLGRFQADVTGAFAMENHWRRS